MRRARARGYPAGRIWSMGPDTCLGTSTRTRTIRPIRRAIRASSNNTALPGPGEEEWTWSVAGGWWLGIPRVIVICSVYTYYYILKVFSTLISLPDLAEVESLSDSAESIDDNDALVVASGGSLIEAMKSHPIPITAESAACRRGGGEEELVLPYSCPCLSLLLFICVIITTYYGG